MKVKVIPKANKITLRVPKLRKGIDSKLLFRRTNNHPLFVEIIYADKSLGTYETNSLNEIILLFFKKLAEINKAIPEKVEEKLKELQKTYLIDKSFVDEQLLKSENFQNSEELKQKIKENFTSYPLEYTDTELFEYANIDIKVIIGLSEKQNIIQATCDKYDLRLKDLADSIGVKEGSLKVFTSSNKISNQVETAIKLYVENIELKEELSKLKSNS